MHAPNHPKLSLIAALSLAALRRDGVEANPEATLEGVADPLARAANWPVYPEIARRLEITDDGLFRRAARDGGAPLTRDEFVDQSFALYETMDRAVLDAALDPRTRKVFGEITF